MEIQYYDIFEQAAAGIAIVHPDGTFRVANQKFCSMVGYSQSELYQLSFADITHPDDLHLDDEKIALVMSGEIDEFDIEKRYNHKDGHPIWIHLHSNVKRDAAGHVEYAIATIFDILQRKKAEVAQRQSNVRFQYVVENQKSGILILEPIGSMKDLNFEMVIKQVNPAFCELFNIQPDQLVGKGLINLDPEIKSLAFFTAVTEAIQTEQARHFPATLYAKNGLYFWFECTISRLPNGEIAVNFDDVTEEVEAKNRILIERDKARQYFDIAAVILLSLDSEGNISAINQQGAALLGAPQEDLIGLNWFQRFILAEDRNDVETIFHDLMIKGVEDHRQVDGKLITLQDEVRTISWQNTLLRDEEGKTYGTLSSGEDVTEQRQTEHELQLINKVIEKSLNAFQITDDDGKFIFVNQAFVDLWGYGSAEEIIGTNCELYCVDPAVPAKVGAILQQQGEYLFEVDAKHKNGSVFTVLMYSRLDYDQDGQPIYPATAVDISSQKRYERELETTSDQLRLLTNHIQNAREEERQHLSREMHDQFGQILSGLKMDLSWLKKRLDLNEIMEKRVREMNSLIDQAIKLTRQISSDLRPGILDDLGLFAALEWYSEQFTARSGIEVVLNLPSEEPTLHASVITAVFRIYQETLTNVYRHAEASKVVVTVEDENKMFKLTVQDNGKGMPLEKPAGSVSLGILGMHERAAILGGNLIIFSQPEQGTALTVIIPDQARQENHGETV